MEIPKTIAGAPTKVIAPVVLAAAAYVGWRFYQARQGAGADTSDSTVADGEFGAVDSSVPGVLGSVSPTNSYGADTGGTTDTGADDPTRFTSDSQWTNYVTDKLSQSDSWSYTDIVTALGSYIASKPMTDTQQSIIRAAIAVGGYPPSGAKTVSSGGSATLSVTPENVHIQTTGQEAVDVAFNEVSGAASYQVYQSGVTPPVGTGSSSPIRVSNLKPSTSYQFFVTPYTAAGVAGPRSAGVSVTTTSFAIPTPAKPSVSSVTVSGARATTGAVPHATEYRWFVNGGIQSVTTTPATTITGLRSKTNYTVIVKAAMPPNSSMSPGSPAASFKTK